MGAILVLAPLNTDAAFCLVVARRLQGGERLYVNIIETNPPLIFWLYAIPAYANRVLEFADDRLVGAFVASILFGSCALAASVLKFASRLTRRMRVAVVCSFAVAAVVPFVQQVGEKEQIAVMLFFPYALVAAREIDGDFLPRPIAVVAVVAAAIGIAIKPFFLAPWIALEAVVAGVTGRRHRERFWLVLAFQVCYGLAVVGNEAYRNHVFPMVRAWYWAYGTSWESVVATKPVLVMAVAAVTGCACFRWFQRSPGAADALVFSASSLGWLIAATSQKKDWFYLLLPALVCTTLAVEFIAIVLIALVGSLRRQPNGRWLQVAAIGAIAAVPVAWFTPRVAYSVRVLYATLRNPYGAGFSALRTFVAERATGEPVYMMSTGMWPMFPVVNLAGATMPYRFHFLWPLPALYARGNRTAASGRDPLQQDPLERAFFDTVVDDLVANPPRVLIVDHDPFQHAMNGVAFDHVAYFSHAPQFRALMQRYKREGSIGPYELFELR